MVGALEHTGALDEVAKGIAYVTGGDRTAELLGILWVSALGSGLVDNIPFTAAMIPVVDSSRASGDDAYWWALALGACFGGNADARRGRRNVAASGMAARAGQPDRLRRVPALRAPGHPAVDAAGHRLHPLRYAVSAHEPPRLADVLREPLAARPTTDRARVRAADRGRLPALPVVDARDRLRGHLRRARVHRGAVPRLPRQLGDRVPARTSTRRSRSARAAATSRSSAT